MVGVSEDRLDETWVLEGAGILIGVPGVADWTGSSVDVLLPSRRGRYAVTFYPTGRQREVVKAPGVSDAKYDAEARRIDLKLEVDAPRPSTILLRKWEMAPLGHEAEPGFNDTTWPLSPRPVALGEAPYGWYRCVIASDRQQDRKLILTNAADAVTVFLNGQCIGQSATKRLMDAPRSFRNPLTFDLAVQKGDNVLAVLAKNWGRHDGMSPAGRSLRWGEPATGGCPVRWYRTTFQLRKAPSRPAARAVLKGLGHGALWLNGRFVGLYQQRGFDSGHGYYLPSAWLKAQNTLVVLEEGGRQPDEAEIRFDRKASLLTHKLRFQ